MEPLPDLSQMDKKALETLVNELYNRSCTVFGDTFDVMHEVKVGQSFLKCVLNN